MQFHETIYGRRFFESDLPDLIKGIKVIGTEMRYANRLKAEELREPKTQDGNAATIELQDRAVTFENSPEMARKVFDAVIGWFEKHNQFHGEGIMQMDAPQIDAAPFLARLADDIIKFKEDWEDE